MHAVVVHCLVLLATVAIVDGDGVLFPQDSETRETKTLDGLWRFEAPANDSNSDLKWMPVPASYNDIATEGRIRDYVGAAWYQRHFFVPKAWEGQRVWVRFGSVNYVGIVFVNDVFVVQHEIGHLPFAADIGRLLHYGGRNKITVMCDNRLGPTTIPQGNVSQVDTDEGLKDKQTYTFDFFNYAGIHRSVYLYTTPQSYIDDITITTETYNHTLALINFSVNVLGTHDGNNIGVKLFDDKGNFVSSATSAEGVLKVPYPNLWWPYLMTPDEDTPPGYLYTLQVELLGDTGILVDTYRLKVGIRTLKWSNDTFELNGRKVYMTGFGRHEDRDIGGRGFDLPTLIRDHNLIKWIGGNAYRTSHYPYSEELMDLADQLGMMIIDECPAVNIENVSEELLENHKTSLSELIQRDKNHPSVIAWSVANEPRSQKPNTKAYFQEVVNHVKMLDGTRPVTASLNRGYFEDQLAGFLDIISFNRYNSWYRNEGQLDMIIKNVINEATSWRTKFNKPILMSEYGADTMEGLHLYPSYIWSEEYQVDVLSRHFKAFDHLRSEGWFIGEFVWNFADFKTSQKTTRVGGNKKGLFTRQREPKAAAHLLRRRYFQLANELYNATIPDDLDAYVIAKSGSKRTMDEL